MLLSHSLLQHPLSLRVFEECILQSKLTCHFVVDHECGLEHSCLITPPSALGTCFKVLHAHLCRLSVTAMTKASSEVLASETLAMALVGSVEVPSAVLAIKRVDPASTKQKEDLQYPDALQKPLNLQPGTQLKVWTCASISKGVQKPNLR